MSFQILSALSCGKVTAPFRNRGTWSGDNIFWEMFCTCTSFKTAAAVNSRSGHINTSRCIINDHLNVFFFLQLWLGVKVARAFYTFCSVPGWDFYDKSSVPLFCVYFFGERSRLKNDENNFSEYFYIVTMFFLPPGKRHQGGKPSLQRVGPGCGKEPNSPTTPSRMKALT